MTVLVGLVMIFGAKPSLAGEELGKAPAEIVHVPTCLSAVAVTYNLPGNPGLRLTPGVVADAER